MDIVKKAVLTALLLCLSLTLIALAQVQNTEPNAAELVRAVRESEMWMYDFNSLYILAEPKWSKSPKAIAQRRREIIEQFNIKDPNEKQFSDLRQHHKNTLEYAVDRKRVRYMSDDPGYCRQLKIWDGNELKIHEKYYYHPQETYIIDNKIEPRMFHELFACYFGWPRSQPHSFWWDLKDVNELMDFYGRPEEFKFIGKKLFREIPCYVLEHDVTEDLNLRWFVGQSDHLLHGIQTRRGNRVDIEHWMLNYREVVPGGWFPMKTGWSFYEKNWIGTDYLKSTCDIDVIEFRLNQSLADELFEMTFQEGFEVQDHRFGELQIYKQLRQWPSLVHKSLPSFDGIDLSSSIPQKGKNLIICFIDMEQRPSRHTVEELVSKSDSLTKDNIEVIIVQASNMETDILNAWRDKMNISFNLGTISGYTDQIRLRWGVKSLPWLILTDAEHIVTAEGFSINELDEKI